LLASRAALCYACENEPDLIDVDAPPDILSMLDDGLDRKATPMQDRGVRHAR